MSGRPRYEQPRVFVTAKGQWPEGPFVKEAPLYAVTVAGLTTRLVAAISADGRSDRQVALTAGIDPGTLSRILSGQAVPDAGTITALEHTLDADLWPGRNS